MVYFWTKDLPITPVCSLTGRSKPTVDDWLNLGMSKKFCFSLFDQHQATVGPEESVQIDES